MLSVSIYVVRFVSFILVQLVALATLTLIAVGPPIVIYETFPSLFAFVRNWTNDAGVIFGGIIGDVGFLALVSCHT